jgi:AraC family transcriptional regulator
MMNGSQGQNERTAARLRLISAEWEDVRAERAWAEAVHLTRFHFQRVFRQHVGETPGELRRRLLLERAAHALATGLGSVTDMAFGAGYDSLEGFSRAFRRAYGLSPSITGASPSRACTCPARPTFITTRARVNRANLRAKE